MVPFVPWYHRTMDKGQRTKDQKPGTRDQDQGPRTRARTCGRFFDLPSRLNRDGEKNVHEYHEDPWYSWTCVAPTTQVPPTLTTRMILLVLLFLQFLLVNQHLLKKFEFMNYLLAFSYFFVL